MIRSRENTDDPFRLIIGMDGSIRPVPDAYSTWSNEDIVDAFPGIAGEVVSNFIFTATVKVAYPVNDCDIIFSDAHDLSFHYRMNCAEILDLLVATSNKEVIVTDSGLAGEFTFVKDNGIVTIKVVENEQ